MIVAATNAGMRLRCIHSIGRTVISARKLASRKGTSKTFAACMPSITITIAAALTTAFGLLIVGSLTRLPGAWI